MKSSGFILFRLKLCGLVCLLTSLSALAGPITVQWRVMTNTGYPTDDAVVYAVSISDPGVQALMPADPSTGDCIAAFQAALNAVYAAGGGTVYVPAGEYLFTTNLTIPANVILRGAWQPLTNNTPGTVGGTILMPTGGAGQSGGTPFLLLGGDQSGVKDLSIWYPNQKATNIVAYPPTIGLNTTSISQALFSLCLQNLNLVNAYDGIILTNGAASAAFVRNIYGSPLHIGLYQEAAHAVPRYENINFSPDYWALSGLSNAPASGGPQATYIYTNGTGVEVSSSDNFFGANWNIKGYYRGIFLDGYDPTDGSLNGNMYGMSVTGCQRAIWVDAIGETTFQNLTLSATNECFFLANRPDGSGILSFNNCSFTSGSSASAFNSTATGNNNAVVLSFQNCSFNRPMSFVNAAMKIGVVNCEFTCPTTAVTLGSKTFTGIFLGNTFTFSPGVATNAAISAAVVVDSRSVACAVAPTFGLTNYNHIRQPAQLLMKVMGVDYPAYADGVTDDSTNIQTALNAVGAAGGGIVFLPYDAQGYALRQPIYVPAGVELRGIGDGIPWYYTYGSVGDGTLLQIYYGAGQTTPCINLTNGCGFKGIVVHYPQQFDSNIVPYSPAIGGTGTNIYVQYCFNVNAY